MIEIRVAIDCNSENWQERKLVCNCAYYLKNNLCDHCLGLAVILEFASFPDEAKSIPIGAKPKRGRPARAKKALLTQ